ncbi:MAG TPA: hypothetical protein VFJ78_06765 [Gaiellaceae bacterium]|nr:hypothetical protein [Gaiellaceae bacterium]
MGLKWVCRFAALGVALVMFAGCGSNGTQHRRDAVNQYIDDVGKAQVDLAGQQGRIDAALAAFSLTKPTAQELAALRRGRAAVDSAVTRVSAVDTPADAARLDRLILERLRLQRSLLDELIRTELDAKVLIAVAPKLRAAAIRLRDDLAAIAAHPSVPKGGSAALLDRYGEAFGRYGDTLRPEVAGLKATDSLLRPTVAEQRRAVSWSVDLCDEIRADLKRRDIGSANAAIHTLLALSATLNGPTVRRAQEAVARSYNAQIARIAKLEQQISAERGRLVRTIG